MNTQRKPYGYWRKWKNVKREVDILIKELGHFPSQNELMDLNKSSFSVAMHNYHGGLNTVRKKLGYALLRERSEDVRSLDYTIEVLKNIMLEHALSDLPSGPFLREIGRNSLENAITRYHGGFRGLRAHMGFEQALTEGENLKDFEYVEKKVKNIMETHNLSSVPNARIFQELGYSGFPQTILKYHGGMRAFRKKMGESITRLPNNSWKDSEFAYSYAIDLLNKYSLQKLPTHQWFKENGHSSFGGAISLYHGGIKLFRNEVSRRRGLATEDQKLEGLLEEYAA